eukprot:2718640-Ditylum_brightwellii.AAC.1
MLDHLLGRYGKITPADIVANNNKCMDVSQPINVHFVCIDDCIQLAADGKTPFSLKQILNIAIHAMQKAVWF